MSFLRDLRGLLDLPQRIEGEVVALRNALAERDKAFAAYREEVDERDKAFAAYREEIDAQLAWLRQTDNVGAIQRLVGVLLRNGKDLPDDIQESALRLQLKIAPDDPQLTRSLVALLHRLGRPPMPDAPLADVPLPSAGRYGGAGDSIDALVASVDGHARDNDLFSAYAALWQTCVRYPDDARGWAEYARCFAERYDWRNCRLAIERAVAIPGVPTPAAAAALLAALCASAEHHRLDDPDWRTWFERLPDPLRVNAHAVRLLVASGDERAAELAPRLLAARPASAASWLAAAMAAFGQERWSDSYHYLWEALSTDLGGTLHTIARDWSAQASAVIAETGKADELADWLSDRHADDPELNLIPACPAPEARLMARRQRSEALDRGLPPFLFVPLGKSASVTVHNLIASGFGLTAVLYSLVDLRVVTSWLRDFQRGGGSFATHLRPLPRNIDLLAAMGVRNVFVHVRDPRQVLISRAEHLHRYTTQLPPIARERLAADPREEVEMTIAADLANTIAWIDGWLKARDKLNVHFTTFEEFIRDHDAFIDRLVALYGGDTRYFDRNLALSQSPAIDFHHRRGEVDEWRRRLDAGQIERVNAQIPDIFWTTFGWSP